jgi:hypothetical protein
VLYDLATATTELGTQAGFAFPSTTTGYLVIGGAIQGVTATISPAGASGPVYGDDNGIPDPTLTSVAASGLIFFGNVAPGRVSVTAHLTNGVSQACWDTTNPSWPSTSGPTSVLDEGDWPATGNASVDAFIVAGAWTMSVGVECLPP